MNISKKTEVLCSSQCPDARRKCVNCPKKNCKLSCSGCTKIYCNISCLRKDMVHHQRTCARFWCVVDKNEKKHGSFNPMPCEGPMRKYICYGCHRIKQLKTKVCENCKNARYCSVKCQKKDWNALHKKTCSTYQAFKSNQKRNEKLTKNRKHLGDKTIEYWSVTKNGNPLPGKYQTQQEAEQARARLNKNKDGNFYAIGEHQMILLS